MATILTRKKISSINYKDKLVRQMKVYRNHGDSILKNQESNEIETLNGRTVRLTLSKKYPRYAGSASEAMLKDKIEKCLRLCRKAGITSLKQNITHYPAGAENLFDLMRMDITARIMDLADYTPYIANIVQNDAFTDPWSAQWFHKYVAPFLEFTGRGDPVNLVQIKTGDKESLYFSLYGVGFEQDLYNQLFNNIFDAMKVTQAVAEGYVLRKNYIVFNPVFTFLYPAAKTVTTATAGTYMENIYDTFQNAITTLGLLRDYQTGEYIDVMSGLTLLVHPTRVRHINRAINGQLTPGSQVKNFTPINEITRIIPYQTRYQFYGNKRIEYTGCGMNDFYLYVPQMYYWLGLKRDLTHVTGEGDTFGITSKKEAWYFVPTIYNTQHFGGDTSAEETSNDPTVMTQDMGYIVHGTLPTVEENT